MAATPTAGLSYQTTRGQLAEDFWTAANGWRNQTLPGPANAAGGPSAIDRSSTSMDVFYRTASGQLAEDFWTAADGWGKPESLKQEVPRIQIEPHISGKPKNWNAGAAFKAQMCLCHRTSRAVCQNSPPPVSSPSAPASAALPVAADGLAAQKGSRNTLDRYEAFVVKMATTSSASRSSTPADAARSTPPRSRSNLRIRPARARQLSARARRAGPYAADPESIGSRQCSGNSRDRGHRSRPAIKVTDPVGGCLLRLPVPGRCCPWQPPACWPLHGVASSEEDPLTSIPGPGIRLRFPGSW